MAVTVGAPTCHRLHHLIHRPPPPSSSLSLFPKPLLLSSSSSAATPFPRHHFLLRRTTTTTTSPSRPFLPARPRIFCHSTTALKVSLQGDEQTQQLEIAEDDDSGEETETEIENLDSEESAQMGSESSPELKINAVKPPTLTVKEKKELASYAHSLGKKLKSQLVGKSGVTASLAAAFVENLESNELLKVKIHGTCPEELEDTVKKLEEGTGSVVVGQIGRTVILYRPSLTKLKAEEKRQESRKVFTRRKFYSRPTMMESQKGERPRMYEHGSPTMMESQKKGGRPRMNGRASRGRTRV